VSCYFQAIDAYQVEDYKLSASMNVLNVAQSVVIYSGMAAGLLVCTKVGEAGGGVRKGVAGVTWLRACWCARLD